MSGNNFTLPDVGHKKSPEKVTPGMENCVILAAISFGKILPLDNALIIRTLTLSLQAFSCNFDDPSIHFFIF
ncbi:MULTISPECIES: hypothetical protein [Acinetobacter]|jgi:hypothetical protein|uniref:Uncharacterized protein n=1 Tax=Acinetobacter schindleri NIPH 900 TaxID=1217675 RepID=N8WQ13_9GAMM|nr:MULTISPECIES: hypothetical protein [Acinetobacter]APX62525.1 hypothetical protein AsACE_CH01118 [Acinetobacter schindleri]AWD71054.1 hypothetical protein C0119_12975 [Acinetobacter schindleri]EIM39435.1 hypothetical protein HADU_06981 [Acinetobacter sp. HA]ENV14202.1 hypothetical protein F965_00445 [Acinetobacter schindleri NIPH 900]KMU99354.1 hypothetical protein ACS72_10570 [Acinetobacter sp. VT 511]